MSPTKRPSSVAAMRRAVAASPAAAAEAAPAAPAAAAGKHVAGICWCGDIHADADAADLYNQVQARIQPPPRPEKPVRFTLDLDRPLHRFLKDYAVQTETDASVVMRALLDELRDDPALAARVQARIWQARAR